MNYASFWIRFAAAFIDGIILQIVGYLVGFIIGVLYTSAGGSPENTDIVVGISGLAGLIIGWLYYALQESSPKQATLGKRAMEIHVTDTEGKRITFAKATGRHFAKILSALILLIGYIMAAFTQKKQALHDMLAGTLVVRDGSYTDK